MAGQENAEVIENKERNEQEQEALEVAEASRETIWKSKSFIASLFLGELDMHLCSPFPFQKKDDDEIGEKFCQKIDAWAKENIDGEEIDRNKKIPPRVYQGMQELGLFALKIPTKYGGQGLSQTNYMRVLATVGQHCISCAVTLSAHQSIGVPQPLKLFGTEEQKQKYLPRIAAGELTAFALTEYEVGSDPGNLGTSATPNADGKSWTLDGTKLWCTNGVIADLYVVMARTPDKEVKGRKVKQITAFIVEAKWQGVDVLYRCQFSGLKGIENGIIRFDKVQVPSENIIAGVGEGLKLALSTLNDGRLGIPAMSAQGSLEVAKFTNSWAKSRKQWGRAVGLHEPGAEKIAYINSAAYAMDTFSKYSAQLSDAGNVDIRMEAAAAKLWATEEFWILVDTAIQLRGGRGYETQASLEERGEPAFPYERIQRDIRVNRILEGSTEIMHLFLAREALDPHFTKAGPLLKRTSIGKKLKALAQCALYYPFWYLGLWAGSLFSFVRPFSGFDMRLASHLRWVDRKTKKMARTLFHQMVLKGPKLEFRHLTLSRIIDIGIELAIMALVAARVQSELKKGEKENLNTVLFWLKNRRLHVNDLFRKISSNTDKDSNKLSKEILARSEDLPPIKADHLKAQEKCYGSELTAPAAPKPKFKSA